MPAEREIRVEAVASVPWENVSQVFGTRGDPARCWCQYFKLPNREFETATPQACAGMLREQVQAGSPRAGRHRLSGRGARRVVRDRAEAGVFATATGEGGQRRQPAGA